MGALLQSPQRVGKVDEASSREREGEQRTGQSSGGGGGQVRQAPLSCEPEHSLILQDSWAPHCLLSSCGCHGPLRPLQHMAVPPRESAMSNTGNPKPMRLGTRSCAECRRRKVRCVFPNEHPPCQQCALRNTSCTAQEPGRGNRSLERLSSGDVQLKQRLAAIESKVRDIWASLGLTVESSSLNKPPLASFTTHGVEIRDGAELEPMPRTISTSNNATLSTASGEPDAAEVGHGFEDAPLLALVKAAYITEELHPVSSQHSINCNADAIHMPDSLMLQDDDLLTVLAATEHYWEIWPPWQYGTQSPTMRTLQTGEIEFAARFLTHMASSNDSSVAAKALLWLSLCIQQAPKTLQFSSRMMSVEKLLDFHMRTADSLLASAACMGETLDGIEARLLQHQLYVDMGRPRQAWLCLRRAANGAMLLRLHRAQA